MLRRIILLVALTGAVSALAPASGAFASAWAGASRTSFGPGTKTIYVRLQVDRFVSRGGRIAAAGRANAVLIDPGTGQRIVRHAQVTFAVSQGATCRILTLRLDKLDLTLLGLNVFLDKVNLSVTGQRSGGILGSLFCSLAARRASVPTKVRALNAGLRRGRIAPMTFSVPVTPPSRKAARSAQAQPANSCPVLSLILGPLHLELLGLIVDLNQVKLKITAYRGQGALGDLFCGLGQPRQLRRA